jgi:hypothetical protein
MGGRRGRVAWLLTVFAGCAAPISSYQPAHVGPRGTFRADLGVDVVVATGAFSSTIDAGKTLARAARSRALSEAEKIQLFSAGLALALDSPGVVEHTRISYNPLDRFEVSLRYASDTWRLGGRYQFLAQENDGVDLSVGLGGARFSYGLPIEDVIDVIRLPEFERWTFDLPITIGRHGEIFRWWTGPRFAYIHHGAELVLSAPGSAGTVAQDDVARSSGSHGFVGFLAGIALGYRYVFLAVELAVGRSFGSTTLDVFGNMVGSKTSADIHSWVLSPGFALVSEF